MTMTNITARRMTLFMVLIVTGCRDGEDAGDAGGTCTPEDDVTFCARLGRNCGVVTELDTCGESRSANCGGCTNPETCGGVGIAGVCGSAVCSDDGWCWENPLPQGDTIFGLSATAADDIWAVGNAGLILHYDGGRWLQVPSGVRARLTSVWAHSADSAWAVGWDSTALRWNGDEWTAVDIGVAGLMLLSVSGTGPGDVWAVGVGETGTTMLHWNGSNWGTTTLSQSLSDVFALAADDVWAVGYGDILHFDGSWAAVPVAETSLNLAAVWASPSGDVYAVGDYTSERGAAMVLHSSGGAFSWVDTGCPAGLNDIWGSSASDLWAVGNGRAVTHWDGVAWTTFDLIPGDHLYSASGVANNLWMSGAGGRMYHWDGADLSRDLGGLPGAASVNDMWGQSADDVWMATDLGLYRRQSGQYQAVGEAAWLRSVWGLGPDPIWAGGRAVIYQLEGQTWTEHSFDEDIFVLDIAGTGPDDIWAVGEGETEAAILHWNGVEWSLDPYRPRGGLSALWIGDATDIWAVGRFSGIHHWNGAEWSAVEVPVSGRFIGVWGSAADDIWASGENGRLLHFAAGSWTEVDAGTGEALWGVCGTGSDDVWAVGQFGGIHHWNGATMTTTLPPGDPQLTGIDCIEDDVFITGGNGALLHLRR